MVNFKSDLFNTIGIANERITPSYHVTKPGKTVKFTCHSYGRVSWTFKGGPLPANAQPVKKHKNTKKKKVVQAYFEMMIKNLKLNNSGTYECQGVDESRNNFEAIAEVFFSCKYTPYSNFIYSLKHIFRKI